jgi:hypothetical protein
VNAKTAKRLRREAADATIGKRAGGYARGRETVVVQKVITQAGVERVASVRHQTFKVHPDTTRGAYLALKRQRG